MRGIDGTVTILAGVDSTGQIKNTRILQGLGYGLDRRGLRPIVAVERPEVNEGQVLVLA